MTTLRVALGVNERRVVLSGTRRVVLLNPTGGVTIPPVDPVTVESQNVIVLSSSPTGPVGPTGPQGLPGPPGSGDLIQFEHQQPNAAVQWGPIVHNLGVLYPDVDTFEPDGSRIVGELVPIDANSCFIRHGIALAGIAILTR